MGAEEQADPRATAVRTCLVLHPQYKHARGCQASNRLHQCHWAECLQAPAGPGKGGGGAFGRWTCSLGRYKLSKWKMKLTQQTWCRASSPYYSLLDFNPRPVPTRLCPKPGNPKCPPCSLQATAPQASYECNLTQSCNLPKTRFPPFCFTFVTQSPWCMNDIDDNTMSQS